MNPRSAPIFFLSNIKNAHVHYYKQVYHMDESQWNDERVGSERNNELCLPISKGNLLKRSLHIYHTTSAKVSKCFEQFSTSQVCLCMICCRIYALTSSKNYNCLSDNVIFYSVIKCTILYVRIKRSRVRLAALHNHSHTTCGNNGENDDFVVSDIRQQNLVCSIVNTMLERFPIRNIQCKVKFTTSKFMFLYYCGKWSTRLLFEKLSFRWTLYL